MTFIALFIAFVLACFLGVELINKVPPTLHTPLMSGSNAMSGITIVGALTLANLVKGSTIAIAGFQCDLAAILGTIALICATINVVGGFLVTDRMLKMFKKGN
jgi:NAD(P) transhydrogenase subunit alpha